MQCSTDSRGNSVPTILLLMQDRLYQNRGLKVREIHPCAMKEQGTVGGNFSSKANVFGNGPNV
ncbi:hypothetical protein IC575_009207 [Cucumis melo]